MTIAADPAPIAFVEVTPAGCRCRRCAVAGPDGAAGRVLRPTRPVRGRRALRAACLSAAVLAGLGAGASAARALPRPDGPGWDGSRYWFRTGG
ncbi:hypothetical protein [Kitasatospora sp. NPDC085879]|uniref:hypothetical protein n=1 Tax=Kitasatospora sp. NPDC085879 TaxID=3154769 RepID=UPI00343CCB54